MFYLVKSAPICLPVCFAQKGKDIQFHMKDGNYKKLETETLHIWKKNIPVFKLMNGVTVSVAS